MPRPLNQSLGSVIIAGDTVRVTVLFTHPDDAELSKSRAVTFPVSDDLRRCIECGVAEALAAQEARRVAAEEAAPAQEAEAQAKRDEELRIAREEDARNLAAIALERLRAEEEAKPARIAAEVAARGGVIAAQQRADEAVAEAIRRGRAGSAPDASADASAPPVADESAPTP